jgi:hypothetical protein
VLTCLIDWTLSLGDLIVGAGTLLLAFVTWQLAKSTAASVEALDFPFLLANPDYEGAFNFRPDDPTADNPDDFHWALSVVVTNLGSGPAILDGIELRTKDGSRRLLKEGWNIDRPVLPEEKDLNLGIPLQVDGAEDEFSPFVLEIFYRSASGLRYVTVHEMEQIRHLGARRLKFERRAAGPERQRTLRVAAPTKTVRPKT